MENGLKVKASRSFRDGPRLDFEFEADFSHAPVHVLFGPSGAGKSTFLRMLAGLSRPDRGRIRFKTQVWFDRDRKIEIPPQLRKVGYVPQTPALFAHLRVAENVAYGSTEPAQASRWLERLELGDLKKRYPHQLSGGQKQRVALARTLASQPSILLLDEPFSSLDTPARDRLRLDLRELLRELRIPAILVTHDRTEAYTLGDALHLLYQGRMLQKGPVDQVFGQPATRQAAEILGIENVFEARLTNQTEKTLVFAAGGHSLECPTPPGRLTGSSLTHLSIRAEDVELEWVAAGQHKANRLLLQVQAVIPEGPMVRLRLKGDLTLVALLPRSSISPAGVKEGDSVWAHLNRDHLRAIACTEPPPLQLT